MGKHMLKIQIELIV